MLVGDSATIGATRVTGAISRTMFSVTILKRIRPPFSIAITPKIANLRTAVQPITKPAETLFRPPMEVETRISFRHQVEGKICIKCKATMSATMPTVSCPMSSSTLKLSLWLHFPKIHNVSRSPVYVTFSTVTKSNIISRLCSRYSPRSWWIPTHRYTDKKDSQSSNHYLQFTFFL